ncbi:MAG: hypothetical protein LBS86_03630 [Treponema sp.]|jgi:TolB-like protein|nr:hypothetical protein [Treponema sp.]
MKRFLPVLLFVCCACAFSVRAEAQTKPKLAVLPFSGGIGNEGDIISQLFSTQAILKTAFTVLPRTSNVEIIMQEHDIERSGLTDSDTIADLGRQLNADFVVSGHIQQLGDRNLIHITIVGVESLQQIAGSYKEYGTKEEIPALLPEMAAKLATTANVDTKGLPKLAVLPFNIPASVNIQDAETLAQLLATELANSRKYAVLPRTRTIEAAMVEQDIQRSGLTDANNVKAIGKATNAEYVLAGTVTSLGSLNLFLTQILNVENGSLLTGDSRQYQTIADGLTLMPQMSDKLTGLQDDRERARIAEQARQQQQEAERQALAEQQRQEAEQQSLAEQEEAKRQEQEALAKKRAWKDKWLFLGLRGGFSLLPYTLADDLSPDNGISSLDTSFSYDGALQIGVQLTSFLAIQAEALVTWEKVSYSGEYLYTGYYNTNLSYSASFTSLSLLTPVLLKLTARPGNVLLSLFGGGYYAIPLGQMTYDSSEYGEASYDYSIPFGWMAGVNLGFKLGPGALFLDARYTGALGFTSISDGQGTRQVYKRTPLSFSIGYEIGLINRRKN